MKGDDIVTAVLNELPTMPVYVSQQILFDVCAIHGIPLNDDLGEMLEHLSLDVNMVLDKVERGIQWANIALTLVGLIAPLLGFGKIADVAEKIQTTYDVLKEKGDLR